MPADSFKGVILKKSQQLDLQRVGKFTNLIEEDGQAVQANQFLIVDGGTGAIIDPGGNLAYNELYMGMSKHFSPQNLSYLIASHADPDIIASLDRWMSSTQAKLVISTVWERFVPHFTKAGKTENRVIGVPDRGGRLPLGHNELWLLPAHFMHSEGNFHFYDPVSRILFTGDLGVSMMSGAQAARPVTDLASHIPLMEAFHRRYMVSNKILRLWAEMVAPLPMRTGRSSEYSTMPGPAVRRRRCRRCASESARDRMADSDGD